MSTATLPLVAGLVRNEGPFYAAHSLIAPVLGDERDVVWLAKPVLTDPAMRWATDDEVLSAHITLDLTTLAELLAHDLTLNPDTLVLAEAAAVIDRQLAAVRCDMDRCCLEVLADQAEHYDGGQRISRCLLAAERLLGIEG